MEVRLSDFLCDVAANRQDLLEIWRNSRPEERAKNVLEAANVNLSDDHRDALLSQKCHRICAELALEGVELEDEGGAEVELHQHHKFGPCWILVG